MYDMISKKLLFLIVLSCISLNVIHVSCAERETWTRLYDDLFQDNQPVSVQQTIDRGFLILGQAHRQAGISYLLIKTDSQGKEIWTSEWGGDFHIYCMGDSIHLLGDNRVVILGIKTVSSLDYTSLNNNQKRTLKGSIL